MRIAIGIEYDGSALMGWQVQPHGPSVQEHVEAALGFVADHPVDVVCSGRTDAGVHARCQVAHFDTTSTRDARGWVLGANSRLPPAICVLWAVPVADTFHARYSALARRYRYSILNRPVRAALDAPYVTWERLPLDAARMHRAAQALVGEHDFTTFRTVACQAKSPVRRVDEITVERSGERVVATLRANAFLHHMVRNIVGSLLPVGRGEKPESWIPELLAARDRSVAGPTAAPNGLEFVGALYPRDFGLPESVSIDASALPPPTGAEDDE